MFESAVRNASLPTIEVDQMGQLLPLSERYEERYLLSFAEAAAFIARLEGRIKAVEVAGTISGHVRNLYLDTPSFSQFHAHFRTARRWKSRVRTYETTGLSRAEIKIRDARGRTKKGYGELKQNVPPDEAKRLALEVMGSGLRPLIDTLEPAVEIAYTR